MRFIVVCFVFIHSVVYSQTKESKDSLAFYAHLAQENINDNQFKNALFYTHKAINISETSGTNIDQAIQTFNLGKIYFSLKKFNDAIAVFSRSISLFESEKLTASYAKTYYYLGLSYLEKRNFNSAEICFNKASFIYEELNIEDSEELLMLQKGIVYRNKNQKEKAAANFNTIIAKPDQPNLRNGKAEALYQMGLIEESDNRNNLALTYFTKAQELNAKTDNLDLKSDILLAISTVHEKLLDKAAAYSYLKQHLNLKESIELSNNEKLGIDEYDYFKEKQRLKKIAKQDEENLENAKTSKFSKLINILAISLISILSLLSLSLYKNNIMRNKSNLLLKEKNKELLVEKEKTEKASKARSEFLSTVSHELRTPLNAINGITHLLLEENPKKSQLPYLSSLKFSGNYLATFINEILEINKIDSNKIEIEYIDFNIKNLLLDIKNTLNELAIKNKNEFILEIDTNIPDNLLGDPTKLSQIFMNLINNAIKFTKDGKVTIRAKVDSLDTKSAVLSFEVADTGIGIPQDRLKSVFESFTQGSVEINRKYGGTGLGLAIVKKLIKLLGGQIQLESEVGRGSTFSFDLQFMVNNELVSIVKTPKSYDDNVFMNKKILLVEDNKINQMITQKMIENKGVICTIVDNGEDAIALVAANTYDLVLMDVHLPGINGTIATKTIRETNNVLPIIALTAISLDENRELLLSYGMNDVITKPFVPEEFYATIAENLIDTNS